MSDLRRIFEGIIREARVISIDRHRVSYTQLGERANTIIALAEEGISRITHGVVETRDPFWEEHGPPDDRQIKRRWMVKVVNLPNGNKLRTDPHLECVDCRGEGCVPAMPGEIPPFDQELSR